MVPERFHGIYDEDWFKSMVIGRRLDLPMYVRVGVLVGDEIQSPPSEVGRDFVRWLENKIGRELIEQHEALLEYWVSDISRMVTEIGKRPVLALTGEEHAHKCQKCQRLYECRGPFCSAVYRTTCDRCSVSIRKTGLDATTDRA